MTMKNKLYYLGILSGMVTACGCLFKIMHWPAAGIILMIGLVSLSLVFLPLAIGNIVKAVQVKKLRNFYILVAIVMAFNFIGALFKIMHWPGAGVLLMVGIPLPFVVLLPAYLLSNPDEKEINYRNLLAIMFFFAYFAAITGLLAMRISSNVVDGFVRSAIAIEDKTNALTENTKLVSGLSGLNNPVNNEADKLCIQINEVKHRILQQKLEDPNIKSDVFLDVKPVIEVRYLTELKAGISNFKDLVQKQYGPDSRLYRYVEDAFAIYDDVSDDLPWEDAWMRDNIIASAIESLNLLEFRVRLVGMESYDFLKK
jgi:hypothetical protein